MDKVFEPFLSEFEFGKKNFKTKSRISCCKILKNQCYHAKVLLKRFHLNGHTTGFHPQTQMLELHYLSPELTLEVKGFICQKFLKKVFFTLDCRLVMWMGRSEMFFSDCFSPLHFRGFAKEYLPVGELLVTSTLEVYKNAMTNLLPTPAKSHYLFNLRDFARVIQGTLLSTPDIIEDPDNLKRLWSHEVRESLT